VNNAGVLREHPALTPEGIDQTWAVNYFAPFLLTHLLLDRVAAAPQGRIVNTASIAHRWGRLDRGPKPPSRGVLLYFDTKLALVVFTRRLAARLAAPTTCNCFHPGVIGTDLAVGRGTIGRLMKLAKPIMKPPEHGARTALYLATAPEVATATGEYFVQTRPRGVSRKVHDDRAAEALWDRSVELTGVGG
jgi:NAD(P)-dependent dehydrogenase (short-subunit alcohol dehydrogenase family)